MAGAGQPLTLRRHEGYDHSYYFIASFIGEHVAHHAKAAPYLNGLAPIGLYAAAAYLVRRNRREQEGEPPRWMCPRMVTRVWKPTSMFSRAWASSLVLKPDPSALMMKAWVLPRT